MNKFLLEVEEFYLKNSYELDDDKRQIFKQIIDKVVQLYLRQYIKSNHTMMELVLALEFIKQGKNIELEKDVGNLIADLIVYNQNYSELIEVETGFVPPEYSGDPVTYRFAREVSKIARYCKFTRYFSLACPPFHILQLPEMILKKPEERTYEELSNIKKVLDLYYKASPIEIEELRNAKLDYIYIINVDKMKIKRVTVEEYFKITYSCREKFY
jgi:hypothetical protein